MPSVTDPLAGVNAVLDEILNFVQEVKQARWRFGSSARLHAELDSLFDDARTWARQLITEEEDHGLSPLAVMPSASVRQAASGDRQFGSAEEIRVVLDATLGRLDDHVAGVLAIQVDSDLRAVLSDVESGVRRHREVLASL